ncbi:MAG: hypothetical protein AAF220_05890 [Pseudomonadota bacterium]
MTSFPARTVPTQAAPTQAVSSQAVGDSPQELFRSAEEAWFWAMLARQALCEGARFVAGAGDRPRPCEPLDLLCVVDRLFRERRLGTGHLHTLARYGAAQRAPDNRIRAEQSDARLWNEALDAMTTPLRAKGIVAVSQHLETSGQRPVDAQGFNRPELCVSTLP